MLSSQKNPRGAILNVQKKTTGKFEQKRVDILDAAAALMNVNGVKGMTFADVARRVGLNTTSVTYYFKKKEQLAAATFSHSLDQIDAMVEVAASQPTPRERCNHFIGQTFARLTAVREQRERQLAVLSDIRALEDPLRKELVDRYNGIFAKIANFFNSGAGGPEHGLSAARAQVLIENFFWLPVWITRYSISDYPRLEARFREIFDHGIALNGAKWPSRPLAISDDDASSKIPDDFIRAATLLVNRRGYRGASVDRIAAELNVTKGSFYHHLDAKDDLVLACFERSYSRVSAAQWAAMQASKHHGEQLALAVATLLDAQFFKPFPLLRTTALQALPNELRADVIDRSNRMARRFAGMMIDGISAGEIRAVDPLIASQMLMAALNSAYDIRRWAGEQANEDTAIRYYASTLAYGLYAPADRI